MRTIITVVSLIALVFGSGCASIVHGGRERVALNSEPADAEVVVVDEQGVEVFRGLTPATVKLKPGKAYFKQKFYTITFAKPGYSPVTVKTDSRIVGWYWANFAIGGLIGFLAVDPVTGDMYTIKPKDISVTLPPQTSSIEPDTIDLRVVDVRDVPASLRHRLVRIN
jgi:hypothetical protein